MALGWNPLSFASSAAQAAAKAAAARAAAAKKPPVHAPVPPTAKPYSMMTDQQIQAEADRRLEAMYASQEDPIKRAAAQAAERALGAQKAEIGFTTAGQQALSQVGPDLANKYLDAKGRINAGTSPEAGAFAGFDQAAIGGTGQAAGSWGEQLGGIQGNLGQETLGSLIASGEQTQKDYEQQLIDLAHQKPELRGQILDQLYQNELSKMQLSQGKDAPLNQEADRRTQATGTLWVVNNGQLVNTHQSTLQGRAETTNEAALGVRARNDQLDYNAAIAKLNAQQKAAIAKAEAAGTQINSQASKGAGYMIDQHGRPVLDANGQRIPYKTTTPSGKATGYQKAVKDAKTLYGKPVGYSGPRKITIPAGYDQATGTATPAQTVLIRGKYMADPAKVKASGRKVFSVKNPSGAGYIMTTNDPKLAKRDSSYDFNGAAQYLVSAYGITLAQAQKALRAAGWKP